MRIKKSEYDYRRNYNKEAYDQIKFVSRKENRLRDLIAIAADNAGISSAQYIINAIQMQLALDGITPACLSDQTAADET